MADGDDEMFGGHGRGPDSRYALTAQERRRQDREADVRSRALAALVGTVMSAPEGTRLARTGELGVVPHSYEERGVLLAMAQEVADALVGLSEDQARLRVEAEPGLFVRFIRGSKATANFGVGRITAVCRGGKIVQAHAG